MSRVRNSLSAPCLAAVAQSVERCVEGAGVVRSIRTGGTRERGMRRGAGMLCRQPPVSSSLTFSTPPATESVGFDSHVVDCPHGAAEQGNRRQTRKAKCGRVQQQNLRQARAKGETHETKTKAGTAKPVRSACQTTQGRCPRQERQGNATRVQEGTATGVWRNDSAAPLLRCQVWV